MTLDLNRRGFLAASLATGAVAAGVVPLTAGRVRAAGMPPRFTPLSQMTGTVTPTPLCFAPAGLSPQAGSSRLTVEGRRVTLRQLARAPQRQANVVFELAGNGADPAAGAGGCDVALGQMHAADWQGVALSDLIDLRGRDADAAVLVHGLDGTVALPAWKAADDVMIATAMNGAPVGDWHGGPLRLVVPGWEGALWMRGVSAVELSAGRWAAATAATAATAGGKPTDSLHASRGGRWSHVLAVNSVVTSPSRSTALRPGAARIEGLAWTGAGSVAAVDVTLDGGRHWQAARVTAAGNRGALQRFVLEVRWDGRPLTVASRATDSTGATQAPAGAWALAPARLAGRHVNEIRTWSVGSDGRVIL